MTANDKELRKLLENMNSVMPDLRDGWSYRGMYDFLLQHGKYYPPQKKARRVDWGKPRHCFNNSILAAIKYGWTYVEGIAVGIIPVHHAWNLRPDGTMVDVTWRTLGLSYCGVEFSIGRADSVNQRESAIFDDWKGGWSLYKEPWLGEDFEKEWPSSHTLRAWERMNVKRKVKV